jgi:NADP-dependent 3-hydroxy acid dehydrogenase YdfG
MSTADKMLEGRIALVTGASSGFGEATAVALASHGATVALAARRVERLQALADVIIEGGGNAFPLRLDVTSEEQVRQGTDEVIRRCGRLDILVNNAGVMLLSPVSEAATEDWRRMIEINLLGTMYMTKAALPLMQQGGGGHIVNVASLAGRIANPTAGAYAATKFGVVGFSESVRREVYKNKIRVTVIEPGMAATELGEHITNAAMKANLSDRLASMEPLQPEDIAAAIVYAVTQPPRVNVNEIVIRPTAQER